MGKAIERWEAAKKIVESMGYELGPWIEETGKNVILKDCKDYAGCKKVIGHIDTSTAGSMKETIKFIKSEG